MNNQKLKAAITALRSMRDKTAMTPVGPEGVTQPAAPAGAAPAGVAPMPPQPVGPGGVPGDPAAMDPAMMDPAMMDPAMMQPPPPEEDPILMLQDIQKTQKQNRQLLAMIVEAMGLQPDLGKLLDAGSDPVAEVKKAAAETDYATEQLKAAGYVEAQPAGTAEALPDLVPAIVPDQVAFDEPAAAFRIAAKMFGE